MMRVMKAAIHDIRVEQEMTFSDEAEDVTFFRDVWPRFYGRLFYCFLLSGFGQERAGLGAEEPGRLIAEEERVASRFFRRHRE
jgi:hypothetical protein